MMELSSSSNYYDVAAMEATLITNVLHQVMPIMAKKRNTQGISEQQFTLFLTNVLRDLEGYKIKLMQPAASFSSALSSPSVSTMRTLYEVCEAHMGSTAAYWRGFWKDFKTLLDPLYVHVEHLRRRTRTFTPLSTMARAGMKRDRISGDGAKRKIGAEAAIPLDTTLRITSEVRQRNDSRSEGRQRNDSRQSNDSRHSTAGDARKRTDSRGTVERRAMDAPDSLAQSTGEMREWDLNMCAAVLQKQKEVSSPPSSPRRRVTTTVTAAEDLQRRTYAGNAQSANVTTHRLFETFDMDAELLAESYAPVFDRNDLFLTNVRDARRLFVLGDTVTQQAKERLAASLPAVDPLTFPYIYVVALRFLGGANTSQAIYVTWCLKHEMDTFLAAVLSNTILCNQHVTALIDSCVRSLGATNHQWKQLFRLEVLDDSGGTMTESSLPVFLASLSGYVDQYVREQSVTCHNAFNAIPHARHRLIYESGSLEAFRYNWMYTKSRHAFLDKLTKITAGLNDCIHTVCTFFQRYCHHLAPPTGATAVSNARASFEINGLWDLFEQHFDGVMQHISGLVGDYSFFKSISQERRKYVQRAYANAQVLEHSASVRIPAALSAMYDESIEDNEFKNTIRVYADMSHGIKHVTAVKTHMMQCWVSAHPDIQDPVKMFVYLRSLVVLQFMAPEQLVVAPGLPADLALRVHDAVMRVVPPPRRDDLSAADITQAWHKCMMAAHPDRCPDNVERATQQAQGINEAKEFILKITALTKSE
jgi:hypothetical protein